MNAPRVSVSAIEQALRDALAPESLQVIDESHLHAGHLLRQDTRNTAAIGKVNAAGSTRCDRQAQLGGREH